MQVACAIPATMPFAQKSSVPVPCENVQHLGAPVSVQSAGLAHRRTTSVPLQLAVPSCVGHAVEDAQATVSAPVVQLGMVPPVTGMCAQQMGVLGSAVHPAGDEHTKPPASPPLLPLLLPLPLPLPPPLPPPLLLPLPPPLVLPLLPPLLLPPLLLPLLLLPPLLLPLPDDDADASPPSLPTGPPPEPLQPHAKATIDPRATRAVVAFMRER
jgi:hypothetical protein